MIAPARAGAGGGRGCESNMSRPRRASTIRSMRRFRVGLGQINPTVGDFEGNVRRIVEAIERARALGCHLVAFPELAVPGYPPEDLLFKPAFIEANLRALDEVARASRGLTVVVGFVDRRDDIFNAAAILHDGERAGVYHKQYLPNYGVFDENRYFQAGTEAPVFAVGETTFAVNVCEDIWYPAGPTTVQALAGAELVVNVNGSPYHVGKARFREQMVATRAADDIVCVAYVNMVGGQDELVFDGASLIVNERGEVVARGRQLEEDFVVVDLDLEAVIPAPVLGSRRRKVELRPGSAGTRRDAQRLAKNLGIEFLTISITPILKAYKRSLARAFKGLKEDVTEENLQARIRGNLLMALSNKFGWLVLTTGNKSEYSVGYTTLYGDMAGGFAVIKDVPKMLVYQVARHVNTQAGREIIPESVFARAPSAELRPDQTDPDTLPPHAEPDAILEGYVEEDRGVNDLLARGFPPGAGRRVVAMVDRNEYKRRQAPLGVKITPRAFGRDWRLPIVNRFRES